MFITACSIDPLTSGDPREFMSGMLSDYNAHLQIFFTSVTQETSKFVTIQAISIMVIRPRKNHYKIVGVLHWP